MWALSASILWASSVAATAQSLNPEGVSDSFAGLYPSRAKTFVKASTDPDDRGFKPTRGNDDGFTGMNKCESYRTRTAAGEVVVLAHKAGRAGFMGCFFRNFWSDSTGLNIKHLERNRTQILIDGGVAYDMPLPDYFRSRSHLAGQIPPFSGSFTGGRAGGHLTHTPIAWENEFEIRVLENAFANAGRFHKVCGTLSGPDQRVLPPNLGDWEEVNSNRGAWPHATKRSPFTTKFTIAPGKAGEILAMGPATFLELSCKVGAVSDWDHLVARFTWDGMAQASVDVPLRVLGGMMKAPHQVPLKAMLFHNDGQKQLTSYYPMPFRTKGRLQFINTSSKQIQLDLTVVLARGAYPEPFGHFSAFHHAGTTQTGVPFQGPKFTEQYGMLRGIMLESGMDTSGRIPGMDSYHLEGDLLVRINGNRGDDHTFAASETSIGKWGWYLSPADKPFAEDSSFHTGIRPASVNGIVETRRLMGSTFIFDPVLFASGIDMRLEHGVLNQSNADYALTTFFYLDAGSARQMVAQIDVGNPTSEAKMKVQFDQRQNYSAFGGFFRDLHYGSNPVVEDVREIGSYYSMVFDTGNDPYESGSYGVGFRLDHLKNQLGDLLQAKVYVDGAYAGLLHVATSNPYFRFKEGGECEVELPRKLTEGKQSFKVEIQPVLGSAPLKLARVWIYGYSK